MFPKPGGNSEATTKLGFIDPRAQKESIQQNLEEFSQKKPDLTSLGLFNPETLSQLPFWLSKLEPIVAQGKVGNLNLGNYDGSHAVHRYAILGVGLYRNLDYQNAPLTLDFCADEEDNQICLGRIG